MAEEKKNAQVINGVNDDIAELKSLSTLRQRVVSDGEIVSKSANGFRLANGNTGVVLRNDGRDFYALTTPGGQALNGQWNTLRPFSFNLASGRVALRNGVDISGGAMVSHNAGISTSTTGPIPLINGQIYYSSPVESKFTSGDKTSTMLMGSRIVGNEQDYGLLSYRDMKGNWNELQVKPNAELSVGQLTKRNPNGWFWAEGVVKKNDALSVTHGLHLQGNGRVYANLYLGERIRENQFVEIQVGDDKSSGLFEFRNNGNAFTNGAWHSSSDARMKTDITQIDGALDKLAKIGGYTYLKQGVPEAGVIAQEVESVLPQSVTQTELKLNDGSVLKDARGININGVVALLVEALKEERAAREGLESRLAALEGMISSQ
ncbi:tail fiber domain-containing protein [Serratia bockelmannii]|uniref:tail fiber domain-containing protein n=2 Tax=Serratia TaxID=613 RepID=UPI0018D6FFE9|nr:tail fiber domain-containing protein [Serratia bockelmannii]EIV2912328.1 tail fiber domain-containing protein [Serratia marcescens]MBH2714437.1 tail fiber domain-containing protein [Serratia marcescens]MBN5262924.1 tail fiber domain-containing protein [Serratia marcescens]MDH7589180.1 tail fiber domain-containing protein [Serratia bockelmannii]HBC7422275.1 tail fiber domain-containing protein [Serratia marcescens]